MEKRKRKHEVTKISNKRKEFIAQKLSSADWNLKVDDKRKYDHVKNGDNNDVNFLLMINDKNFLTKIHPLLMKKQML